MLSMEKPKLFASPTSWIEGSAVLQLEQAAALPEMRAVAGMPDLHPGKGSPVGLAALTQGRVYPHLIGNDQGCGYSLFQTDILASKARPDRLAERLRGLDIPWDGDAETYLNARSVDGAAYTAGLGTLGGGNHFAELQKVEAVADPARFAAAGLDQTRLVLLVHSGSRGLGEAIFQRFAALCGARGFAEGSEDAGAYLAAHAHAVRWASASRALIAERLLECLGADGAPVLDLPHNFVEMTPVGLLHRKGAAPADRGLSPLPGSRGTPTFLLNPTASAPKDSLATLPHGAGRKVSRANMHDRSLGGAKQMARTSLGGVVVCGDQTLMQEEHPSAYKAVEQVVADVKQHGLATEVAMLYPVLTYKSAATKDASGRQPKRDKEEGWRRERRERSHG